MLNGPLLLCWATEEDDGRPKAFCQPQYHMKYLVLHRKLTIGYGVNAGARGSVVVKALCYKPEDRGYDTR
jgi:hypothetical protein